MYKFEGFDYSKEEVEQAAADSNLSVDDYVIKHGLEISEPGDEEEDTEDVNAGKQEGVVVEDATVTPQVASKESDSKQEDSSSVSQPDKKLSASEKRIKTREDRKSAAIAEEKRQAIEATKIIDQRIANISEEDIVSTQASVYFGDIKSRDHREAVDSGYTVPGAMGPTMTFKNSFNSDEQYTNYLKNTLGNKYEQYISYNKTGELKPINDTNKAELDGLYNSAWEENQIKVYNNSLFDVPENIQKHMVASPKFATGAESVDIQKEFIKEQENTLNENFEQYSLNKKLWDEEAVPLYEEAKSLKGQIDRFQFYIQGASKEQIDQYNGLITQFNSKLQQYEDKGFNELPVFLNKQAELVNSQKDSYATMLEDSRKALVSADLFEKQLLKDYSTSARVGRAWDEFFIQSGRNFLDLTAELGLRGVKTLKNLYSPLSALAYDDKIDPVIQTIQKNNKNYNLNIAAKRENIPTAPSIDDIGKNGVSVWDWTAISLQDNSATIATTFVPGVMGLKGTAGISKAVRTGKGMKEALQSQRALWLAGKNTVQGTFFVAESGGKYGQIQTEEAQREQDIKLLYSQLDNTEDIEEKTNILSDIEELENVDNYSLLQKAFTSFGAGATATYAESIGTLKMLEPSKNLIKTIGVKAAKKELYKSPSRFGLNIANATLSGLKQIPKNTSIELLEETATQVAHNGLDIYVLGENKSLLEGVNKDFVANTMVSSFGIMAPKTMNNTINLVKSEFRTKAEVLNNQRLAKELILLNEGTTFENINSKEIRAKKKDLLKQLALSDAISLHKLRYMSSEQIEEVSDINRQIREINAKSEQLGRQGDVSDAENISVRQGLEQEAKNLTEAKQNILNSKQKSNTKKAQAINNALGEAARNSKAAYWYGVNNFYNEVAMTQMGDGDFVTVDGTLQEDGTIVYDNIDETLAKYKDSTIKDENGKEVNAFDFIKENIEKGTFNGTKIGNDIIINQAVIDRNISLSPTDTSAGYAAVAPLEELFHISISEKGIKFDDSAKRAVKEAEEALKEKFELGKITEEDYKGIQRRFNLYRDGQNFDAEEFIAQINNAVAIGAISRSDIESMPSFKKFLNNGIKSVFGDMGWMLSLETSDDVFNLVKNFQTDVSKGVIFQAPSEDEDVKLSLSADGSAKVNQIYEEMGMAGAMDILDLLRPTAKGLAQRFRNRPDYDEQLIIDEILTGKRGMLDTFMQYDKKVQAGEQMGPLSGFLNNLWSTKTGFKRYIEIAERVVGQEFTDDVTTKVNVEAEAADTDSIGSEVKVKRAIKPTSMLSTDMSRKAVDDVVAEIENIDTKKKTFKGLPNLAADAVAEEIGIPVKKIVDPKANLSKGDASSIQRFIMKNADRLLKIMPEGAVLEAATDKLMGTSTGVPKGLLNSFYTKGERIGKGAGLSPFKKNKDISKSEFLAAFGIVDGKKAEDFNPRSPQAQALKGMASLYSRLVTNEIVRTKSDFTLAEKQDIAAGKSKAMFSKAETLKVYHGGDVKSINDIDGNFYASPTKAEAVKYAEGNEGKVREFSIDTDKIVDEDVVREIIAELGIKPQDGMEAEELNLYEMIDQDFPTAFNDSDMAKLEKTIADKGIKAVEFLDMSLVSGKNDTYNIVVFDKDIVKEDSDKAPKQELVYNASPKSFEELGDRSGLIFLATDKREAEAYAEMNNGDVKNIYVDKNSIAEEQQLIDAMEEVGVDTSEGLVYELIDERFEDYYIGEDKMKQVVGILADKGFKGVRYEDGAQVAREAESIVVFDKSAISDKKAVTKAKPKMSKSDATLLDATGARSINDLVKLMKMGKVTVNDGNRPDKQVSIDKGVVDGKLPSLIFEAPKFANFGKWNKRGILVDGKLTAPPKGSKVKAPKYFKTKAGKLILENSAEYKKAEETGDFQTGRGGLYYGVSDALYKETLKKAKENDKLYPNLKKPSRVAKDYFSDKGAQQSKDNAEFLDTMVTILDAAYKNGSMSIEDVALYITKSYQATSGAIKIGAPFVYRSKEMKYGIGAKQRTGEMYREEHNPPASVIGSSIIYGIANGNVQEIMAKVKENFTQTLLSKHHDEMLDNAKLDAVLPSGFTVMDHPAVRYAAAGIDLNSIVNNSTGKTMAEEIGLGIKQSDVTPDVVKVQNDVVLKVIKGDMTAKQGKAYVEAFAKQKTIPKAAKTNDARTPDFIKFSKSDNVTNEQVVENLAKLDKAIDNAKNPDAPIKKIRVFDFDDTLAQTKSNVLYTLNGKEGKLTAEQFAQRASKLEAEGAVFDFSEFNVVTEGKKGPLFKVAQKIAEVRGTEDVFVLTARSQAAAGPIQEFLKSQGLDIPLRNITGLGNGAGEAKARWIVDKASEGYNDFYFADDAPQNVKAVKDALSLLDVKSKTQQAYVKFSKTDQLSREFNDIIENKTGIASNKKYGSVKAEVVGKGKGRFSMFIPATAEDFVGLLYKTLGKGTVGDQQMAWYNNNLIKPYAKAMNEVSLTRTALTSDYKALKKQLGIIPKNLKKKIPGEHFTKEQAIRVYIWGKQGMDVPGISKQDMSDLTDYVANDSNLQVFADQLIAIQKGDKYAAPKKGWTAGTISTDILETLNTTKRKKSLEKWKKNVDIIFSTENLNKLEAAFGPKYRYAMENMLQRMESGRNKSYGTDTTTAKFTQWLTGSVGTTMFLNTRSALLQTISAINFVNWSDNNPFKAAAAFANQPQYWSDFKKLINSDFLKERRGGMKLDVNESDIADMAKNNGAQGVIGKLLQLGFAPTQAADSFAIASGGATFYRNRIKKYKKQGFSDQEAEAKAFEDFRETAEESQQSSRPDKISAQQAGPLGRIVLAFANTPAQYARLIKKAALDLKNGRGDAKTNISKIIYYGAVQNLIFNALQQALFAVSMGDTEEEEEKRQDKYLTIANGMMDSLLRGAGIGGAILSVGKNAMIKVSKEMDKSRPNYENAALEIAQLSPPVASKISKLRGAAKTFQWNKKQIKAAGWDYDNPAYLASANIISATTNIPLDRLVKKSNNIVSATGQDLENWQRLALIAGYSDWQLGLETSRDKFKKKSGAKTRYTTRKSKVSRYKVRK